MDGARRESEAGFAAYVDSLAGVLGHADRAGGQLDRDHAQAIDDRPGKIALSMPMLPSRRRRGGTSANACDTVELGPECIGSPRPPSALLPRRAIAASREDPKIFRVDDAEIVGDGRREFVEPLRHGIWTKSVRSVRRNHFACRNRAMIVAPRTRGSFENRILQPTRLKNSLTTIYPYGMRYGQVGYSVRRASLTGTCRLYF